MYEIRIIEGSYGVSVEAKINIENVKMLLVLSQAAQYRGRRRIEAVCETTVTGAVALRCSQGDENFSIHNHRDLLRYMPHSVTEFLYFLLSNSFISLFISFCYTDQSMVWTIEEFGFKSRQWQDIFLSFKISRLALRVQPAFYAKGI
jgi:hypothetical protein